jgi:DNA replication protein DnaC
MSQLSQSHRVTPAQAPANLLLETQLKQLKLPAFVAHYSVLAQDAARNNLSYERYLLGLVQEEVNQRERRSVERAVRQAKFPVIKDLAEFDFGALPDLPSKRILDLAQGGYLKQSEPIILLGNPGLGKTHIACGLALAACRQGRRVRFYTAAGLVNELMVAQRDYRLSRVVAGALKQDVIVLDELGFIPFTESGAQLLFQFCAALYERVALIVTTNLHFAEWGRVLGGDDKLAAALLDRLTHRAHILEFVGTSFRFRQQLVLTQNGNGNGGARAVVEASGASSETELTNRSGTSHLETENGATASESESENNR